MTHRILPLLLPLAALGACAAPSLDAGVRYGILGLDGDVTTNSPSPTTNTFDGLGLGDDEETPGVHADLKWGSPHLSISTQSSGFSGRGIVQSQLDIGGGTINVGSPVDSDVDVDVTSALLTFDLAPTDELELGLGFGIVGLGLDLSFTDVGTMVNASSDETVPIPVLAARVGVRSGSWEVGGSLSGLDVKVDDDSVTFFDLDAFARYSFAGEGRVSTALTLGYRATDFELEYTDGPDRVDADLEVAGPYIGIRFSF